MKLFDLHCDTLYNIYHAKEDFYDNNMNISLQKARCFDDYSQVLAIWSRNTLSEAECFSEFLNIYKYYKEKIPASFRSVLAIEGGKALDGKIENLKLFYSMGVRILTLMWGGVCSLGGAHDTDEGLTPFGYEVTRRCFELGIIPDVSHASDKAFWQVCELSAEYSKPFIASHSNSRNVYFHSRNLTDEMFSEIVKSMGVVGVSLEPTHLSAETEPDAESVCAHILHYLDIGGKDTLCLGCDFDGVSRNLSDIPDISALYKIADALASHGIDDDQINKIFYDNANNFVTRNIKL